MRLKSILSGIISCLPGGNKWLFKRYSEKRPDSGTSSARYCYSVWLRHLVLANKYGVIDGVPGTVAELGPGGSLGTGLAALISGANKYVAFDVVAHAEDETNIKVFDELIELFVNKSEIPGNKEFPDIQTELDNYDFPSTILGDELLQEMLSEERIAKIRNEILFPQNHALSHISYVVPWNDENQLLINSVDMIFSMSVLEHVDNLSEAYRVCHLWLKNDGFMSHEIDFKSHGHSDVWNGHWACSEIIWKLIVGCRPYLINRVPYSRHIEQLKLSGFEIVASLPKVDKSGVSRKELSPKFRYLTNQDMCTHNVFLLSKK